VRRVIPVLVAGALIAPAAPAPAAIDGVVIHRENDPALTGEPVHFTAAPSGQPDGLVRFDWGLECDASGPFDWTTNTYSGGFDRIFATAGEHSVCVRAHDYGASHSDATTFTVVDPGNRRPVAALSIAPSIAPVGGEVTFDASGSRDADGDTLHYYFDIDGEPGFEVDNGNSAKLKQTYVASATFDAAVQVIDPSGAKDQTKVKLVIGDPNPLRVKLSASARGRVVSVRVTTGRKAKVRVEVRTPDATLVGSGTGQIKSRSRALKVRLRRRFARIVVIATATDADGVSARAVKRLTVK
jgi:hypothetical protein